MRPLPYLLVTFAAALATATAIEPRNLVQNGGFDTIEDNRHPHAWLNISHENHLQKCGISLEVPNELGNSFYRITKLQTTNVGLGEQIVPLDPPVKRIRVAVRLRTNSFQRGEVEWQAPGLAFAWTTAEASGRKDIGWGKWLLATGPSKEWIETERVLDRPESTTGIKLTVLGIGWTGVVELDDIVVQPVE